MTGEDGFGGEVEEIFLYLKPFLPVLHNYETKERISD